MTDSIYKRLKGKAKHTTTYKKQEIPKEYHYAKGAGVLPIQLYADIHWRLAYNDTTSKSAKNGDKVRMTFRGKENEFKLQNNTGERS